MIYKPFNFKNIDDFDKHINLSIPSYDTLMNIFSGVLLEYAQPETNVVDIGCSTGKFLSQLNQIAECNYFGIDKNDMNKHSNFKFVQGDLETELQEIKNISVIVSMFTLQFLGSKKRNRVLKIIKQKIDEGAIFLVAEKVYLNDPIIQTLIHRMHVQEKRSNFSDKDILDKDTQLSVSMFCKDEGNLIDEFKSLGTVCKIWQSYNFMGFVVKNDWTVY